MFEGERGERKGESVRKGVRVQVCVYLWDYYVQVVCVSLCPSVGFWEWKTHTSASEKPSHVCGCVWLFHTVCVWRGLFASGVRVQVYACACSFMFVCTGVCARACPLQAFPHPDTTVRGWLGVKESVHPVLNGVFASLVVMSIMLGCISQSIPANLTASGNTATVKLTSTGSSPAPSFRIVYTSWASGKPQCSPNTPPLQKKTFREKICLSCWHLVCLFRLYPPPPPLLMHCSRTLENISVVLASCLPIFR